MLAVLAYHDARKKTEPQEQKMMLMARRVADKERALLLHLKQQRTAACERARRADLNAETLFPHLSPWRLFPWEAAFRPRSAREDRLRQV